MKKIFVVMLACLSLVGCSSKEEKKEPVKVPDSYTSVSVMGDKRFMIDIKNYLIRDRDYGYEIEVGEYVKVAIGWGMLDLAEEYDYSLEKVQKGDFEELKYQIGLELLSSSITKDDVVLTSEGKVGDMELYSGSIKFAGKEYGLQVVGVVIGDYPVYVSAVDLTEGGSNKELLKGFLEDIAKSYSEL